MINDNISPNEKLLEKVISKNLDEQAQQTLDMQTHLEKNREMMTRKLETRKAPTGSSN